MVRLIQTQSALLEVRCGRQILITAVNARDASRDRGVDLSATRWESDPLALATALDVDVVVELIGGAEGIARELAERALANGKHLVTANKALIARHGKALAITAEHSNLTLAFEAAVAGGIPILKTFREGFAGNRIKRVVGILNGTCNYILDQIQKTGRSFETVLAEAQALGYAEADPSFDVDGIDTAHKLAILTSLAYGVAPNMESIFIEGIRKVSLDDITYADALGYNIKLLGIARPTARGIEQRVHPCMVKQDQPLALIPDVYNAIETEGDFVGNALLQGRGAGGGPTASAVVADIIDIARGHRVFAFGKPAAQLAPLTPSPMEAHRGAYYLRVKVVDQPGVLASISSICFEEGISLESCIQRGRNPLEPVQLAMITHETDEHRMSKALARIEELTNICEPPHMIRIEPL